jgi:hypothetical protein
MGLALFVPEIDLKRAALLASAALKKAGPQAPRAIAGDLIPAEADVPTERETNG